MYGDKDNEDLRIQIFHLKKKLSTTESENLLLKVKIRKLQNEVIKKDKQMDLILDPKKNADLKKILYERSATFVLSIKEKNDELLQLLHEKDILIRKLQKQLDVAKLYSQLPKKYFCCSKCTNYEQQKNNQRFKSNSLPTENEKKLSWNTPKLKVTADSSSTTLVEDFPTIEEQLDEEGNCKNQLLSLLENLRNNENSSRIGSSRKSSPESDLDRIEVLCESPHEEIQQLHLHFLEMISEVDHLKSTIGRLQNNQEKTENVLKLKDSDIDNLIKEIKNLQKSKCKTPPSNKKYKNKSRNSADVIARVYSANSNITCSRNVEKAKRNYRHNSSKSQSGKTKKRNETSDVMTQVELEDEPQQCIYVERSSISITPKSATPSSPNKTDKNDKNSHVEKLSEGGEENESIE